ncbi:MAG: acetolactate synthase large subunit [Myxococcota bacterium]
MKASDLLVQALQHEGVEYVFGIPGEENLDLLESLRTSDIRLVLCRHEQAAGFMAATYGRLTGKAGVCLSTLGPGATNFMTAAAYAQLGAMPMLMITGQKPIKRSKQGRFQIIDVVEMMKPVTKFALQLVNGHRICGNVREAFRCAQMERPGAAHLELPEDVAAETVEDSFLYPRQTIRRPAAEEKAVRKAVGMIESARRPLLLIGAGANRTMTSKMLTAFVEKTQIPFFDTQMGKGVIDERHQRFLGTAALSDGDYLHRAIQNADLIINVGHDVVEKPPFFMTPSGIQVVHVNFFSAQVDDVYFPQHEVVGDIANAIWQISERIEPQPHWDFSIADQVRTDVRAHTQTHANDTSFPVKPQHFVSVTRDLMPDDGIVALDNGMYKIWFARGYPAHEPNTLLLDNALATMGAGLPSAMAAALLYPDRKVMAVVGDGGFMMNSQEIETAVRLGLNLVVVILNDSGYGMIKWKQNAMGFQDYGLDFKNPDFVKYAESYGAHGHRIESIEALVPSLRTCLDTSGVHVVDLPIDYSENVRLTEELRALANE